MSAETARYVLALLTDSSRELEGTLERLATRQPPSPATQGTPAADPNHAPAGHALVRVH